MHIDSMASLLQQAMQLCVCAVVCCVQISWQFILCACMCAYASPCCMAFCTADYPTAHRLVGCYVGWQIGLVKQCCTDLLDSVTCFVPSMAPDCDFALPAGCTLAPWQAGGGSQCGRQVWGGKHSMGAGCSTGVQCTIAVMTCETASQAIGDVHYIKATHSGASERSNRAFSCPNRVFAHSVDC